MDFADHPLNTQYSNSYSKESLNNSNSTVEEVFSNLTDVIPVDDYMPFYVSKYKNLGHKRFLELANKARNTDRDPKRLFFWMLKNNRIVR